MAPSGKAAGLARRLKSAGRPLKVATSFPDLLRRCASRDKLNMVPDGTIISGSVEVMPRLLGVPMVADLVSSGTTARANGLVEVMTLLDVFPSIVVRSAVPRRTQGYVSYGDIDRIDEVLDRRSRQIPDKSTESYTLKLMRDANEAGKKAGEEFGEVMMAISGSGDAADCESEIADLTYAQLVAAYSQGKPARLSNVIRILVDRNRGAL